MSGEVKYVSFDGKLHPSQIINELHQKQGEVTMIAVAYIDSDENLTLKFSEGCPLKAEGMANRLLSFISKNGGIEVQPITSDPSG